MKNFEILSDALDYIENNLCEEILQENIAKACYCSLSQLQKLFRYVFHLSVGDYISRRRLTNAAKELIETDSGVLETAVKYGYNSAEVFTRAFKRVWKVTPVEFRREWTFSGLFPPLKYDGGNIMSNKFDLSELYDYLKSNENTYIISFDMVGLMPLNSNYGHEAGDKAILECLRRIDSAAKDNMIAFRIGGDEFVLCTGISDKGAVKAIAEEILSENGGTIEHDGADIHVSMRAGAIKISGRNIRYCELFTNLRDVSRPKDKNIDCISCYFAD